MPRRLERNDTKRKGRFCDSCAKVVVDFTSMNDEEIVEYLQQHSKQKTCGHFKNEQVLQNENIQIDLLKIPKNIPFKSLLLVCFLSFFSAMFFISCNSSRHVKGKVIVTDSKKQSLKAQKKDAIKGSLRGRVDIKRKKTE